MEVLQKETLNSLEEQKAYYKTRFSRSLARLLIFSANGLEDTSVLHTEMKMLTHYGKLFDIFNSAVDECLDYFYTPVADDEEYDHQIFTKYQ